MTKYKNRKPGYSRFWLLELCVWELFEIWCFVLEISARRSQERQRKTLFGAHDGYCLRRWAIAHPRGERELPAGVEDGGAYDE
jgi:hypothetical protein